MEDKAKFAEAVAAFQRGALDAARALVDDQLAQAPGSPPLQHLRGLIECRLGELVSGIEWLGQASAAQPANVPFRVMWVRALVDAGRASEALEAAIRPATAGRGEVALWHARAEAADAAAEYAAAAEAWAAMTSAHPADWRAWTNLGRSLLAASRFGDAEAAYRRAVDLAPTNRDAVHELGVIYERTNRPEASAELLDAALAAGIGKAELAELWAMRAQRAGHFDEARAQLLGTPAGRRSIHWQRLRVKIADASGDAAEAFAAASAMNQAADDQEMWRARAADYRRELRDLANVITPEWAGRLPQLPPDERRPPAFLVGFPRSGTTLLDTFLMGHPGIAVIEEKGLLRSAAKSVGPIAALPECASATLAQARATYRALLVGHGPSAGHLVVDKAPLNMVLGPLIHCLFGNAPILFAQRHPCDAVLSGFMQAFEPNLGMASFLDIADAADFYDAAMRVWSASAEALPLNVHRLKYEELVADPERVLRPAVRFLGLEWDERLLDHRGTAAARGVVLTASYDQVTEPLYGRSAGRWRRYAKQLGPVLPVLLPWAERFGYGAD